MQTRMALPWHYTTPQCFSEVFFNQRQISPTQGLGRALAMQAGHIEAQQQGWVKLGRAGGSPPGSRALAVPRQPSLAAHPALLPAWAVQAACTD